MIGADTGRAASPSGSITTQSNRLCMGNNNITNAYIKVAWTVTSDKRDKTDIKPLTMGLNFVNELEPVTYKWDMRSDYKDGKPDGTHKKENLQGGLLAQDVEELERAYGYKVEDGTSILTDKNPDGNYGLTYSKFIPVLINAVQELSTQVDELKSELLALKGE
jgi:trimeric autotransporter adhesin